MAGGDYGSCGSCGSYAITPDQLSRGLVISTPGRYALLEAATVTLPSFPTAKTWSVWFEGRPCLLRIQSDDVSLDLGGLQLAVANDQVQQAVLVGVDAGRARVSVSDGLLGRSAIGLFFGLGCAGCSAQRLTIQDFAEKGVLAYSPQSLLLGDLLVGPNLTALSVSQETATLLAYGAAVRPQDLAAWRASNDDLAVQETAHLAGVALVPDAAHDAPNVPSVDTGGAVTLERVTIQGLHWYYREHSLRVAVAVGPRRVVRPAVGLLDEPLPGFYQLRIAAARRLNVGFLPALLQCPRVHPFITDEGGFLQNVGDAGTIWVTAWTRGVDRLGEALRGAQGLLVVGCGTPTLTDVSVGIPQVTALQPRLDAPPACEAANLVVSTRGLAEVVLPAPPSTVPCCSHAGAAAYFARGNVTFNVQPTSTYQASTSGSFGIL